MSNPLHRVSPSLLLAALLVVPSVVFPAIATPLFQLLQLKTNASIYKEFPKTEPSVTFWEFNDPRGPIVVVPMSSGGPAGQGRLIRIPGITNAMSDIVLFTNSVLFGSEPQGPFIDPGQSIPGIGSGFMFGTCRTGGANGLGCIVRVRTDGAFVMMRSFLGDGVDGRYPNGGLTFWPSTGFFYGTTPEGGKNSGGTLFRIRPDGTGYSVLFHFGGYEGDVRNPHGQLAGIDDATHFDLFGTSSVGGIDDAGTLFRFRPSNNDLAIRWHFGNAPQHGLNPSGGPTATREGSELALYGLTASGGTNGAGTLYRYDDSGFGAYAMRHFGATPTDARNPRGRVAISGAPDKRYVGTSTQGGEFGKGTVFAVGSDPEILRSFSGGGADGQLPLAGVVISEGVAVGTTAQGGFDDAGVIFRIGLGYNLPLVWTNTTKSGSTASFELWGDPLVRYTVESSPAGNPTNWTRAGSIVPGIFGKATWTTNVSGSTGRLFRAVWP